MDLYRTIRDLVEERQRLDAIISRLEEMESVDPARGRRKPAKRRGRKSMSETERQKVSERMRKYWEKRRSESARGGSTAS